MADFRCVIHELLPRSTSIGESMQALIDAHARQYPDGDWGPFYSIDYDQEIASLRRDWFGTMIVKWPPAAVPVAALYFGLFHPALWPDPVSNYATDFRVGGSCQFSTNKHVIPCPKR